MSKTEKGRGDGCRCTEFVFYYCCFQIIRKQYYVDVLPLYVGEITVIWMRKMKYGTISHQM